MYTLPIISGICLSLCLPMTDDRRSIRPVSLSLNRQRLQWYASFGKLASINAVFINCNGQLSASCQMQALDVKMVLKLCILYLSGVVT